MSFGDLAIIATRWLHVMATVTWVGGNIIFYIVLKPSSDDLNSKLLSASSGKSFGEIVELSKWVLIITGALLALDNLSTRIAIPYFAILSLKIGLSFLMFMLGFKFSKKRSANSDGKRSNFLSLSGFRGHRIIWFFSGFSKYMNTRNMLFVLGPIVIFLGIALRAV
tara:strand:- start:24277 stop:24774 length:498 start_codon:yes stop_codon:yes gene_type:complete